MLLFDPTVGTECMRAITLRVCRHTHKDSVACFFSLDGALQQETKQKHGYTIHVQLYSTYQQWTLFLFGIQLEKPVYRKDQNTSGRAGSYREKSMYTVSLPNDKREDIAETHHLNPILIRVQDEGDFFYLPVSEALFELHAEPLKACASGLDVGHGDRNVAESARLGIARVVGCLVERLRAMVVSKLEDA